MENFEAGGTVFCARMTIASLPAIKAATGIDVEQTTELSGMFVQLMKSVNLRMSFLYSISTDPTGPMIPKSEFMELLDGETLAAADQAFWDELSFFFQSTNPEISKAISETITQIKAGQTEIIKAISELAPEMERLTKEKIETAKRTLSGM